MSSEKSYPFNYIVVSQILHESTYFYEKTDKIKLQKSSRFGGIGPAWRIVPVGRR
jgi:hypothetical protein